MIVLDLEWNRGYDKKPLDEILQIGAVRVERRGGPILDTFNAYIKPRVHKKLGPGAKMLPELGASLTSELTFPDAMEAFRAWCGEETVFASWGGDDPATLTRSCEYWHVPALTMEKVYDFQRAFSHQVGTNQSVALWRAAEYCGVPDTFTFHNALNDALYTAILGGWLSEEDLEWTPPKKPAKARALRFNRTPFPRQERQKVGPCDSPEGVLNAKLGRRAACPFCGKVTGVTRWYETAGHDPSVRRFLSLFSCPEHGAFLCQLTLARLPDGRWRGRRTVPSLTAELVEEYHAARKGEPHICQGRRSRKRRRR